MNVLAVERMLIESGLRKAVDRSELLLHSQPKVTDGMAVRSELEVNSPIQ
jgi:hypothetical protein